MEIARSARHASLITGLLLLCVYVGTAAPSLTFWDASEFATAIGTFGIPHPPGTPLYVALGTALWHLSPGLTPVQAGSMLSASCTALACALAAWIVVRVSGQRALGVVAGLCAGAMGTVWMNATETEVYAASLLSVAVQCALAWRAFEADDDRARIALAYIGALSLPLHLSALVATPAAMLLANTDRTGRVRWAPLVASGELVLATVFLSHGRLVLAAICVVGATTSPGLARLLPLGKSSRRTDAASSMRWLRAAGLTTLLGWSALCILLVRARHAPFLNQGDPDTFAKLVDVFTRAQYDVAAPWPRRAPLWLQLGNIMQYADWQVALSLWNDVTPSPVRTPLSVLAAAVGAVGAVAHWRTHRVTARAMAVLILLATVGVCLQLNLRAGPSFGYGVLPDDALREARERDYFYALAFWCWGLWIGVGAWVLARRTAKPLLVAAVVPMAMLASNWRAIARDALPERRLANGIAAEFLHDVPVGGMLFTAGDNDSYPLWYKQTVDSLRPDVHVVVTSLLPANWYFRESAERAGGFVADTTIAAMPMARAGVLAQQQLDRKGSVAVSILLSSGERTELGRVAMITCWRRFGLIDMGTRTAVCPPRINAERATASASRLAPLLTPAVRQSIDGMAAAFQKIAHCPRAAVATELRGGAPPDSASRALLDITCNLQ